jgi:hypothetical protein
MKNILIKGSGDITKDQKFIDFVLSKVQFNYVVVICGGGTKISEAFKEAGYPVNFDERGCRITKTREERMLMCDVLEKEKKDLCQRLGDNHNPYIVAPLLDVGSVLCPINGDDLVKAYYLGFDEIYVFTLSGRLEKKKTIFKDFPKVNIIEL